MSEQDEYELWLPHIVILNAATMSLNGIGGMEQYQHRFMFNSDWIKVAPNDNLAFDVPPGTWMPVDHGWTLLQSAKASGNPTLIFARNVVGTDPMTP